MLNPNPDTGIDSIINLNTESTSLVDVPVTTNVEMPPSYVTTLPPPPIPLIQPQQQTPVPTPVIVLTVSSIPGIVDKYLANQINEAVKAVKIIKEQVKIQVKEQVTKILLKLEKLVNEQLEAEILIRLSNEAKTSHDVAANLSELELKKILIDKMENNKRRDDKDEDEEPSARTNRGSKRRRDAKEPESTSALKEKTSKSTGKSKEGFKSHQKSTGKLTNLNVEERLALGVSLRMFARSIVTRRRVEDLQLGIKSYQKKLNLINPDTYRSDLKRKTPYTAYSNPRGFIYQNKDKKNRLMRIDELYKFSDVWRNVDMERAGALIQAIDQQLRNRRIIRSLEKFVGGRPFDTLAGNHVKEILLKLNLPDHNSILMDSKSILIKFKGKETMEMIKILLLDQTKGRRRRKGKKKILSHPKTKFTPVHPRKVFSTWMAFGGNTHNLGSFGEETGEITDLHQILEKVLLTARGDGVTGIM
ncbi:hypothetical protein Tco_0583386 [Tanacetum coccineum]